MRQILAICGVLAMVALVQIGSRDVAVELEHVRPVAEASLPVASEPTATVVPAPEFAAAHSLVAQPESQVA